MAWSCWPHTQPQNWRTTLCWLSAIALNIFTVTYISQYLVNFSTLNLKTRHAVVTIKKNTNLANASKEIGKEVNAEKTEYIAFSSGECMQESRNEGSKRII
jgi:hypothetical protein